MKKRNIPEKEEKFIREIKSLTNWAVFITIVMFVSLIISTIIGDIKGMLFFGFTLISSILSIGLILKMFEMFAHSKYFEIIIKELKEKIKNEI